MLASSADRGWLSNDAQDAVKYLNKVLDGGMSLTGMSTLPFAKSKTPGFLLCYQLMAKDLQLKILPEDSPERVCSRPLHSVFRQD